MKEREWPLEVRHIEYDSNWDPEEEPTECARCKSKNLSQETAGAFTAWIECLDCNLWHPFIDEDLIPNIIKDLLDGKKQNE